MNIDANNKGDETENNSESSEPAKQTPRSPLRDLRPEKDPMGAAGNRAMPSAGQSP